MEKVGLNQAARLAGVSRWTIYRKIQGGVLSATTDHQGRRVVDVAELLRVYGTLCNTPHGADPHAVLQPAPSSAPSAPSPESAAAIEALERHISRLERELADARGEAKDWQQRYVKAVDRLLLTDQRPDQQQAPKKRRPPRPRRPPTPQPTPSLADMLGMVAARLLPATTRGH